MECTRLAGTGHRVAYAVLVAAVLSPLSAQEHQALPFDETLRTVMRFSGTDFRSVQGPKVENKRREFYYEAALYLPEANYCRILKDKEWMYLCEWRKKSRAEAPQLFEKLTGQVQAALGGNWQMTSKTGPAKIFYAEGKPVVQLNLHEERSEVHLLVLRAGSSKEGFTGKIPTTEELTFR
jgi:hypothetical protein